MNTEIELFVRQPLLALMESGETHCVAYCCGVDAFEISPAQVGYWISQQGREPAELAARQLHALIAEVKTCQLEVKSGRFNARWSPAACVVWLTEWETALNEALKLDADKAMPDDETGRL